MTNPKTFDEYFTSDIITPPTMDVSVENLPEMPRVVISDVNFKAEEEFLLPTNHLVRKLITINNDDTYLFRTTDCQIAIRAQGDQDHIIVSNLNGNVVSENYILNLSNMDIDIPILQDSADKIYIANIFSKSEILQDYYQSKFKYIDKTDNFSVVKTKNIHIKATGWTENYVYPVYLTKASNNKYYLLVYRTYQVVEPFNSYYAKEYGLFVSINEELFEFNLLHTFPEKMTNDVEAEFFEKSFIATDEELYIYSNYQKDSTGNMKYLDYLFKFNMLTGELFNLIGTPQETMRHMFDLLTLNNQLGSTVQTNAIYDKKTETFYYTDGTYFYKLNKEGTAYKEINLPYPNPDEFGINRYLQYPYFMWDYVNNRLAIQYTYPNSTTQVDPGDYFYFHYGYLGTKINGEIDWDLVQDGVIYKENITDYLLSIQTQSTLDYMNTRSTLTFAVDDRGKKIWTPFNFNVSRAFKEGNQVKVSALYQLEDEARLPFLTGQIVGVNLSEINSNEVDVSIDSGSELLNSKTFDNFLLPDSPLENVIKELLIKAWIPESQIILPTTNIVIGATLFTNDKSIAEHINDILTHQPEYLLTKRRDGKYELKYIDFNNIKTNINISEITTASLSPNEEFFNVVNVKSEAFDNEGTIRTVRDQNHIDNYKKNETTVSVSAFGNTADLDIFGNKFLKVYKDRLYRMNVETMYIRADLEAGDIITLTDPRFTEVDENTLWLVESVQDTDEHQNWASTLSLISIRL